MIFSDALPIISLVATGLMAAVTYVHRKFVSQAEFNIHRDVMESQRETVCVRITALKERVDAQHQEIKEALADFKGDLRNLRN